MIEKYKLMSVVFFTAIWFQFCWVFISSELIPMLETTQSYVFLLCDVVYLIMGLITIKSRRDIIVFVSFMVIAVASAVVNHQGIVVFTNGMREFFGLLFMVPIVRYFLSGPDSSRFVRSVDKQLYVFLCIQLPCLLFQYFKYGAGDYGGGSLGYGNSGIITTLIFLISFYFMNKRWDGDRTYLGNLRNNWLLIILLIMTFLNETKVGFVYMIAYIVFLMRIDRKFIIRLLFMTPILVAVFTLMCYLYLATSEADTEMFGDTFFNDYFFGEDFDWLVEMAINAQYAGAEYDNIVDLPRFSRFLILPEVLDDTGGGFILGAGIGQFKGGSVMAATPLSVTYRWLLSGSVITAFFVILQLGIVGLVWIISTLFSVVFTPDKHARGNNILMYMLLVIVLTFIYNDMVRQAYVCFILFYICLFGMQPCDRKLSNVIAD